MEYLSLKDATTSYKVSDRTLRTAIAKLPTDERAKAVQSKGNKLFVSSEFLKARFELRVPPPDTPGPKPNTNTDTPFIWFVIGLIFGLVVIGLVVVIYK